MRFIKTIEETNIILEELKERDQWVLWKLSEVIDKETGEIKETKIPYQTNGKKATSTDSSTWTRYDEVLKVYKSSGTYNGVGFVLTENDPFTLIDIDKCVEDGQVYPEALAIIKRVNSYTEYSQSGTGFHIIIKGKKPGNRCKNPEKRIEIYDKERFMIMSGNHVKGTSTKIEERQDALEFVYKRYFPESKNNKKLLLSTSNKMSDQEVLEIGFNARNGNKIKELYDGNWSGYGSQSEADQALCNYIAFYTQDYEQIDRIFASSGLYRDKWDRQDYKTNTIQNAINGLNATYQKNEFQVVVKERSNVNVKKGSWWNENNGKLSFLHDVMAKYILQENKIVRFPNEDGDIYIYNKATGIFEIDKTCRQLRSLIRDSEVLKRNQVREVQEYIVDMSQVVKEESKSYIAVENGLLQLNSMDFKEFTPDVFVTKKIPTKYNPNAFDEFVENTLKKVSDGHLPTIKNIHEMFGAVLYPTLLVPKMFYLYGRSAHNGKSTVLYMIQKTFNSGTNISAVSPQKLATNTFAGSSIYGKLANIVDDQPDEIIQDSGTLKTIITGGYIDIEYKGKGSQTVQMSTVCITASNHYPNFREHGNQINKRLHILPFDHNFMNDPDRISEMESMKQLETENAREYVLKLAVEAIKEMTKRAADILTYNDKAEEAKGNFAEYNDPLADFFFEYDKQFFDEVKGTDALKAYDDWCKDNHIQHPLGQKRFKDAVCAKYDMEWKSKKVKINGTSKTVKGFKSKTVTKR